MTYYVHVNRNKIDSNRKNKTNEPVVRFQKGKYGKSTYCHRVKIKEGEFIYQPHGEPILPCGARMVIQTEFEPVIIE